MTFQARPTPGSERALEFFLQYETDAFLKLIPSYNLESPSCATVLNHGDYWHTNIMLRLNPQTKIPEECVVIDWQVDYIEVVKN